MTIKSLKMKTADRGDGKHMYHSPMVRLVSTALRARITAESLNGTSSDDYEYGEEIDF